MTALNQIQTYLNLSLTSELDEFTEAAIRNLQVKHSIPVTGQPDQQTVDLIVKLNEGLIDTDLTSLSIKKYYLNSDEYFNTNLKKRSIFLHHTAGWDNPYRVINDWEKDKRGRVGTAYVIGGQNPNTLSTQYNGEILECMPPYTSYAWHLGIGRNNTHETSVGIELCNFGWVKQAKNGYRSYPMETRPNGILFNKDLDVIKLSKPFRGQDFWIKYTDEQISSLDYLIRKIGKDTGIDITLGLQKRIKNMKDVYKAFDFDPAIVQSADGLFSHTNVSGPNKWGNYEKWDIFPQDEIIEMIKNF